jgi:transcription antitermination factor NusG
MYCVENNIESSGNFHWNALHTRYQHERKVEALLSAKGFQTFLPTYESTRRWKDRNKRGEEALFPGYLFVANASEDRLHVVATPGVCAIVSVAGAPATISNQEIEAIRKTVSNPAKVEPHPYLNSGDQVEVQWGPLAGVEGILIRKRDSYRLVVSVEILGRAAAVEIDASCIAKVSSGRTLDPVQSSCPVNRAQFSS